jgi:SAM-dependent methyltransferase
VRERFDAVLCLGNSFPHLFAEHDRRKALAEFYAILEPDGLLVVDHRNYDVVLDEGRVSRRSYCCSDDGIGLRAERVDEDLVTLRYDFPDGFVHRLNTYPIRRDMMRGLLEDAGFSEVDIHGDYEDAAAKPDGTPEFFVHLAEKFPRGAQDGPPVPGKRESVGKRRSLDILSHKQPQQAEGKSSCCSG